MQANDMLEAAVNAVPENDTKGVKAARAFVMQLKPSKADIRAGVTAERKGGKAQKAGKGKSKRRVAVPEVVLKYIEENIEAVTDNQSVEASEAAEAPEARGATAKDNEISVIVTDYSWLKAPSTPITVAK